MLNKMAEAEGGGGEVKINMGFVLRGQGKDEDDAYRKTFGFQKQAVALIRQWGLEMVNTTMSIGEDLLEDEPAEGEETNGPVHGKD